MEKATLRTLCLIILILGTFSISMGQTDSITGNVFYQYNYPLSGVNAYLHLPEGTIIDTTMTDNAGFYKFSNVNPGDYTVSFSFDQPEGGVDLEDAFLIQQFVLGDTTFSPIQELAAEVTGDGLINMDDYYSIWNEYMNQGKAFNIGPWVFETTSVTIPTPSRDGFVSRAGSSSGDVNGNLQPDPKSNQIYLDSPVLNVSKGSAEPFEFNLTGGENLQIAGMHLVINIPEGLEVLSVESPLSGASINISEGIIKVTWIDETCQGIEIAEGNTLLVINSRANRLSRDGDQYSLKLDDKSHFISTDGKLISGVSLILPTINLNLQEELTHTAYPNPFINSTTIEFQVPQDGQVTVSLYDLSGRLVFETENSNIPAGSQQVKIDGSSLLPGIYHYSIRYSGSGSSINSGTVIKSK